MNFLKRIVLSVLGFGILSSAALFAQEYLDNALYVKFKETSSISAKKFQRDIVPIEYLQLKISDKKMANNGFHREASSMSLFDNEFLDRTFKIQFDSTVNINKVIRMLESDPNVELVERVPIFKLLAAEPAQSVPNDPFYTSEVDGKDLLWYLKMINAEGAWALQKGDSNIKVAVVDGAVWGEHPDLKIPSKYQYNACTMTVGSSAPVSSVNQDAQCTTLYPPASGGDPCPVYTWSHGTHCAGVVGAINDNEIGMASLASGVTLLGVRATTAQWPGSVVAGYEGIRWAAQDAGAKVISCSWGSTSGGSDVGNSILKECYDKGITIVAAAGNDNISDKGEPASSIYVITVGSVDENKAKSSFSNYGNWVDILAPGGSALPAHGGVGVVSTTFCKSQSLRLYSNVTALNDEYYDEMSGTSMATPLVASLCALMLSKDSTLTPAQIKDILQNTSHPINGRFTPLAGIIDAEAAIKAISTTKFGAPVENLAIEKGIADTVWFKWNHPKSSDKVLGYNVYCNGVMLDTCTSDTTYKYFPAPAGQNVFLVSAVYENNVVSTRKETRYISPEMYQISVLIRPKEGGTVTGIGKYANSSTATLVATPNEGYHFVEWGRIGSSNPVSTRASYTFRVNSKETYVAYFEKDVANEQEGEQTFSLTPNPARDNVKIGSPALIERITVVDLQGRTLRQIDKVNAMEYTLDVQNLENGTYIVMLKTQNGTLQQKFVKL
ncbi:MAG: S8 family serine peptidase [Bacteroides sp.]|nr:S8 family serine peptidase [Ruminococcus flavefaciens]MCM1553998.1 S8 family serine peptidase [Bacteroides sp.]